MAVRVDGVDVATTLSGFEVTVYRMIGLPPSEAGALQLTVAWPFPATAVTPVGGSGGSGGVTALEGADGRLVPTALVAVTAKV